MTQRPRPQISSRKQPRQARANDLVAAVLQAAIQVLAEEGAHRFTTSRVAERAGVSVGSLYQYFPNKAAILFRLQSDEWRRTTAMLRATLEEAGQPPLARLRRLVHVFLHSECEEAPMRVALGDAAPLYRDAPETLALMAEGDGVTDAFLREALPQAPEAVRTLAGDLLKTTLSAVCSEYSATPRSRADIDAYADALADMMCGYLERLGAR